MDVEKILFLIDRRLYQAREGFTQPAYLRKFHYYDNKINILLIFNVKIVKITAKAQIIHRA